jgi:hypothetical protein
MDRKRPKVRKPVTPRHEELDELSGGAFNTGPRTYRPVSVRVPGLDGPRNRTSLALEQETTKQRALLYQVNEAFKFQLKLIANRLESFESDVDDIIRFIRWFNPYRHRSMDTAKRMKRFSHELKDTLTAYVSFVFRFRVQLLANRSANGKLKLTTVCEDVSPPFLRAILRNGRLLPLKDDQPYNDYRDNLRSKRPKFTEALKSELFRFMVLELNSDLSRRVGTSGKSELLQVIDTFYDPLKLNFIIVDRKVFKAPVQSYLFCLVGEMISLEQWRTGGAVKTKLTEYIYGRSPRGRKPLKESLDLLPQILKNKLDAKIDSLTDESGNAGDGRDDRKIIQRSRRMTARANKEIRPRK